jgi:glycosyltransferase involved in cell wall biosynthesis/tetratricopeptide (TPR) repeat protein
MSLRYLFGPVEADFADQNLRAARDAGACLAFDTNPGADLVLDFEESWESFASRFPPGWQPDLLFLSLGYRNIPAALWQAPLPRVGLAPDMNLLASAYRLLLPCLDLVLCDQPSVVVCQRHGFSHARPAQLFGIEPAFFADSFPTGPRDIDLLFVGNLRPDVQRERLAWLARLAPFAASYKVVITQGIHGDDYRDLLRRSRIVFNRSIRGECNRRVFEACAAGALLLNEAGNAEVEQLLRPGQDYIAYHDGDLEALLEHYLTHEDERGRIAQSGWERTHACRFSDFWDALVARLERDGVPRRADRAAAPSLLARTWAAPDSINGTDPTLLPQLTAAVQRGDVDADTLNLLAVALASQFPPYTPLPPEAWDAVARCLEQALARDPGHLVAGLNLVEALCEHRRHDAARTLAEQTLRRLDDLATLPAALLDAPRYPPCFDLFRVEWNRAAWEHADDPAAEARRKHALLRCRLHALLGDLTGELSHYHEAVLACPDLPVPHAALGCALGRAGRPALAVPHLRAAVAGNPFDLPAARALCQALLDAQRQDAADRLAHDYRLLHQAAPAVVAVQPWFAPHAPPTPAASSSRFHSLSPDAFTTRFGRLDTARALCSYTPPQDTHAVLTLLAHTQARRILEIGTAFGHMTANLSEWSPDDAVVYSLGTTRDMGITGPADQQVEAPDAVTFGAKSGHFGKGQKVRLLTADSLTFDFASLGEFDFVFVDGAHDLEHVLSDTRKAYAQLRPGGCLVWHDFDNPTPWVEVRAALERADLSEPIYHVAGSLVAFLFKGEGTRPRGTAGVTPAAHTAARHALVWEGSFTGLHSLALVNRAVCARLLARGHEVSLKPREFPADLGVPELPLAPTLARVLRAPLSRSPDVHIRHFWPPDFRPPESGRLVVMQHWEYGSLPSAWVPPLRDAVAEVWVASRHARDGFVASGVPAGKVVVVPLGVDPAQFHPEVPAFPLRTRKGYKFLFVGGTIWRKGIDVLLAAYGRAFTAQDDVCLVLKDMGGGSFYRDQTGQAALARLRELPNAPEVEYLDAPLSPEELAGLYAACDCLVHPYRGEGFGLPIAEALACGRPVIVTGVGAARDFCNERNAYLIPARLMHFPEKRVDALETVDFPTVAEPDADALVELLRHAAAHPDQGRAKGRLGSEHIRRHFTWDHTAAIVEQRLHELSRRPAVRPTPAARVAAPRKSRRQRISLCMMVKNEEGNLPDCLRSAAGLFDEINIADTGSTDRTKEIARAFGARVSDFPWCDSFAAARNASMRHASGDYIFWLDADDRLDEDNRAKLRDLFDHLPEQPTAFSMKCLCLPDPIDKSATVVDHIRLFPNLLGLRWEFRVHEQILPALRARLVPVVFSDVVIQHTGYQDPALRGRKLQRDLRLLQLELRDHPEHPFALFNLGSIYQELGQHELALDALQRSLAGSRPDDSIVRKLFALIAVQQRLLGRHSDAIHTCRRGRQVVGDDGELLFREGVLLWEAGNLVEAEALFLHLLSLPPPEHFASVDPAIYGYKTRNYLGLIYLRQRRLDAAHSQWQAALQQCPHFLPGWQGLSEVALAAGDWRLLEEVAQQVQALPGCAAEAERMRLSGMLARREFRPALAWTEELIRAAPREVTWRLLKSHALLLEDRDYEAAERALRDVLLLEPGHKEALNNLSVHLRRRMRTENQVFSALADLHLWVLQQHYESACVTPSEMQDYLPVLNELARDCKHVTVLGLRSYEAALALLAANPQQFACCDDVLRPEVEKLRGLAGTMPFAFLVCDTRQAPQEETDLLFLDTLRTGDQLREQLARLGSHVRRFVVIAGTGRYAEQGETPGSPGLWPVVAEFVAQGTFQIRRRYEAGLGMTILERVGA